MRKILLLLLLPGFFISSAFCNREPILLYQETLDSDIAQIDVSYIIFAGTDTRNSVTRDFTLLTTSASSNPITWTSSDDSRVMISGDTATVKRPPYGSGDTTVILTATVTRGGESGTKTFILTVLEKDPKAGDKVTYTDGTVSFRMAYVPGGITFPSGKLATGWTMDDAHATVDDPYLIAETEVTYELWSKVYNWATSNGYTFANAGRQGGDADNCAGAAVGTDQHPVTCINWRDAMVWANALTEYYNYMNNTSLEPVYYFDAGYTSPVRDVVDDDSHTTELGGDYTSAVNPNPGGFDDPYVKATATGFRLPTAVEWEMAARWFGTTAPGTGGALDSEYVTLDLRDDGTSSLTPNYYWTPGDYASGATAYYYDDPATSNVAVWYSSLTTAPVKSKADNALGIYDMSGNVWEWNYSWYSVGSTRQVYSGAYFDGLLWMQVGYRNDINPDYICEGFGFRLTKNP